MNVFTVDVEDGISIAMRDAFNKNIPQTRRVVSNTMKILDLLDTNNTKGTFFVLGQVAEFFPELIVDIHKRGHELGIHGYNHLQFFNLTPVKAFNEISRAKKLVEDIIGNQVFGHRAPAFSIMPSTKWGLDIISEAGFLYDSSIMPSSSDRYGWNGFSKDIIRLETSLGNSLIEVPVTVDSIFGFNFTVCGGSYLRLLPKFLTEYSFKRIQKIRPVNVYVHPYEVDVEKYPDFYFRELYNTTFKKRLLMKSNWINRSTVINKLDNLLKSNSFDLMINIVRQNELEVKTVFIK